MYEVSEGNVMFDVILLYTCSKVLLCALILWKHDRDESRDVQSSELDENCAQSQEICFISSSS